MGNKKIVVTFVDDGIDSGINEWKLLINKLGEVNESVLEAYCELHGTKVFSVFYLTLSRLLKKHNPHNVRLKDVLRIYDYNILQHQDLLKKRQSYTQKYETNTQFLRMCLNQSYPYSDTINLSFAAFFAENALGYEVNAMNTFIQNVYENDVFLVTAAGDNRWMTSNDIIPQNQLYVFTVGATNRQVFNISEELRNSVVYRQMGHTMTAPNSAIVVSAPGQYIAHNSLSFPWVVGDDGDLVYRHNFPNRSYKKYVQVSGTSFASAYVAALKTYIEILGLNDKRLGALNLANVEHMIVESAGKIAQENFSDWGDDAINEFLSQPQRNAANKVFYAGYGLGEINEDKFLYHVKTWRGKDIEEELVALDCLGETYEDGYYCYTYKCDKDNLAYKVRLDFANDEELRNNIDYLSITSPSLTESHIYHPLVSPKESWQQLKTIKKRSVNRGFISEFLEDYLSQRINNSAVSTHFYREETIGDWMIKSNVRLGKKSVQLRSFYSPSKNRTVINLINERSILTSYAQEK